MFAMVKLYAMHIPFKYDKVSTVAADIVRRERPGHNSSSTPDGLSVAAFRISCYNKLWFRLYSWSTEPAGARSESSIPGRGTNNFLPTSRVVLPFAVHRVPAVCPVTMMDERGRSTVIISIRRTGLQKCCFQHWYLRAAMNSDETES